MVPFVQIPCKSGWPSGVRGGVHFLAATVWLLMGPSTSDASVIATARVPMEAANRWLILSLLFTRSF